VSVALGITDRPERVAWWVCFWVAQTGNLYSLLTNAHSRRLKLWILSIGLLSTAVAWLVARTIRAKRRRESAAWPAASGVVQSATVRLVTNTLQGQYAVETVYSYLAGSERYGGYAQRLFRKESEAEAEAARLRDASAVVKYNPRNPEMSLLSL
jgi:hypothetical protein